ncbi:hypothetical protein ES705_20560 [subsurface metagenome]
MSAGQGWIGLMGQVLHYLRVVGADRDEDGRFVTAGGDGVASFLGLEGENVDAVINADVVYFVGGKPCGLAAGLRTTSYGLGAVVIY